MTLLEGVKYSALTVAFILSIINVVGRKFGGERGLTTVDEVLLLFTILSGFLAVLMQILESRNKSRDAAEAQRVIQNTLQGQQEILRKQGDILSRIQKGMYPISGIHAVLSFDDSLEQVANICPSYFKRLDEYISRLPKDYVLGHPKLEMMTFNDIQIRDHDCSLSSPLNPEALLILPDGPLFPNPVVYPEENVFLSTLLSRRIDLSFSHRPLNEQEISLDWEKTGGFAGLITLPDVCFVGTCDFSKRENRMALIYYPKKHRFGQVVSFNAMGVAKVDDGLTSIYDVNGCYIQLCARSLLCSLESLKYASVSFVERNVCYDEFTNYLRGQDAEVLTKSLIIQFRRPFRIKRANA